MGLELVQENLRFAHNPSKSPLNNAAQHKTLNENQILNLSAFTL
jgi:hypothetical protein